PVLHVETEPRMIEQDLSQFSMLDLFRAEAETQALVLTSGLLALERDPTLADQLEACMGAAHSLKGAARIVGLAVGVRVAHAMEDCFVAAQEGRLTLRHTHIDVLLGASDRVLRVTADNLNRLLSLAGESLVESRWVKPFAESILRLKRLHHHLGKTLEGAREAALGRLTTDSAQEALGE